MKILLFNCIAIFIFLGCKKPEILNKNDRLVKEKSITGKYDIVQIDDKDEPTSIYLGQGKSLSYKNISLISENNQAGKAFIDFTTSKVTLNKDPNNKINY